MYDKSHKMTVGEIASASNPKKKKKKKSFNKKTAGIRRPVKKETPIYVPPDKKSGY